MQPHFINYFFTNELIQAMFRTLMHSLWQGILLASVAGIILVSTKNAGAGLRYKLFCGVLLAFIFTSFATFCYELYIVSHNAAVTSQPAIVGATGIINIQQHSGLIERIISVFKSGKNFIVLAWFTIITLKSLKLLAGLRSVHILKHKQVSSAGEYWNKQLKELAVKAGITKQVTLLKSAIAEIPMVLGHLKPVILFPASALTSLAPEEIEAILLHELAHIRRKDYLINILQSLAEILFFFNPAVLWISSLIKEERENCCDDIAIKQVKNKKQFIRALVSFQEYNLNSKYAASFSGKRNHLLNRIKRIITNNNKTLTNMEKIFLAAGIIITCFTAAAFTGYKQFSATPLPFTAKKTAPVANTKDTVLPTVTNDESKSVINADMDGKKYRLVEVNGQAIELYVDNAKIPADKLKDYADTINKLHEKMKAAQQEQVAAMKVQKMAMDSSIEKMKAQALAMNDMHMNEKVQAEMEKATEIMQKVQVEKMDEVMKEKAIMMKDQAKNIAEIMKEKDIMMKDQVKKIAAIAKEKAVMSTAQVEMIKAQNEKVKEIMKQKDEVIKDAVKQQDKLIKIQVDKEVQQELKKQIEDLKQQNKELQQQLKQKADSIYKSN